MRPWARWAIVGATVVGVVVLFVVLSPGSDDGPSSTPSTPTSTGSPSTSPSASPSPTESPEPGTVIEITYRNGAVQGPTEFSATQGEPLTIVVRADVSDEVHLHGYDLHADVAPGEPARIELTPDVPGVFQCELEDAGKLLFRLEITP